MRRLARAVLLLAVLGAGTLVLSRTLASDPDAFPSDDGPANPLPPCPASPNCVRLTRLYPVDADTLFARARDALAALGPATLDAGARRADAVFRVFVFYDDVALRVEPFGTGSALHLRSASRVGYSDFGVNERRVRRFLDALHRRLPGA
ncbi:DUF1499 domain-containing protein [Rhodocaloribacter litoris]|uniref:DUF1499 domain-containing protein n=1 Tax=Rhodocaloribacter litoris TaxID=2558931 RepID=UPI0014230693|nr:DUF1499 domain-containing protein [Rhodocaloribacter litoris]QXD14147.1 DUF1499 domain-containing protein [Rhodocaloribacter litoris]